MAKKQLIKELEKQDKEELVRLLAEMSKRFPVANMYLTMEFGFENAGIIEKYKKALEKEYFPARGHGKARSSRINKILKEFTQIAAFKDDILEMKWYQIERAVVYYRSYHYEYEPFINNLIKNWSAFLSAAKSENSLSQFEKRIQNLFTDGFKKFWLYEKFWEIYNQPEDSKDDDPDDK